MIIKTYNTLWLNGEYQHVQVAQAESLNPLRTNLEHAE